MPTCAMPAPATTSPRGAEFGAPGDWTVTVTVRTSRFDEDAAELEVPIR